MLVICIGDGLGNQMFQFAFFRALQKRYPECKVEVDICNFYASVNEHNGYELGRIFGLQPKECSLFVMYALADYFPRYNKKHRILNRLLKYRMEFFGPTGTLLTEQDPTVYEKRFFELNTKHSYMFRGNWINEKYFSDIKEQLFQDFAFPDFDDEKNKKIALDIKNSNSVSIHIRRGDYVGSGMSLLGEEYYREAVSVLREKVGENLRFFVFSDDTQGVKNVIEFLGDYKIVSGNQGKNSFRDMQLMSLCKHNIIANSTFSFWGAYLNQYPGKIVIAPKVAAPQYKNPFACEDWIKI